jgi:hypothetical protein
MTRSIPASWLILASALGLAALACEPGGVGDPCVPEDEYQTTFGGYDESEVNVESRSFQCETRVCLVNHFRGRVSCPYGQTEGDLALPGTDPKRCRIPGTSGTNPVDVVSVPVPAQLQSRSAAASPDHGGDDVKDAVYCSCRCDGPDPNARYCECPSGFECTKLIDDLGLGSAQLAGSYCIKSGSKYNPAQGGAKCNPAVSNCGNGGKNP